MAAGTAATSSLLAAARCLQDWQTRPACWDSHRLDARGLGWVSLDATAVGLLLSIRHSVRGVIVQGPAVACSL